MTKPLVGSVHVVPSATGLVFCNISVFGPYRPVVDIVEGCGYVGSAGTILAGAYDRQRNGHRLNLVGAAEEGVSDASRFGAGVC